MSTAVLASPTTMPRKRTTEAAEHDPNAKKRVPAQVTNAVHDRLRVLCLIKLRRPIEVVIGEWVAERLAQEERKLAK
jgi:ABC-type anion transport system duplicated permease subunit